MTMQKGSNKVNVCIGKLDWKSESSDGEWECDSAKVNLNKVNRHKGVNGMNGTGKPVNTSKKC